MEESEEVQVCSGGELYGMGRRMGDWQVVGGEKCVEGQVCRERCRQAGRWWRVVSRSVAVTAQLGAGKRRRVYGTLPPSPTPPPCPRIPAQTGYSRTAAASLGVTRYLSYNFNENCYASADDAGKTRHVAAAGLDPW